MRRERIVVVGAGAAGVRAAERLRELNFGGELVIVGEEPYRPYHRPALSKQVLSGTLRPKDITLPVHADLNAVWRPRTRAVRLDPEEHVVHLPGGEELDYDGLVIATGMQARHLPGAPRHDPRVHVLRTLNDAVRVRKQLAGGGYLSGPRLRRAGRVALVGGGYVSGELASVARELGRDATIILRDDGLLRGVPGSDVSPMVEALHRAHGVEVVTGATIVHWVQRADGIALHLSTGQVVAAGCVVLGVGAVPAVDWLRGSGLLVDDGVLCGPTCHALCVDDVVVAGDVARWPNLRFDTVPRRVEHWFNAIEMGRAAAENLVRGRAFSQPFTPLPRFWSDQHGVRIQAAGLPALAQDTVSLAGSVPVARRVTGYVADGALVGVLAWDSPRGMLHWAAELERQTSQAMRHRHTAPAVPAVPVVRPDRVPDWPTEFDLPAVTSSLPPVAATEEPLPVVGAGFPPDPGAATQIIDRPTEFVDLPLVPALPDPGAPTELVDQPLVPAAGERQARPPRPDDYKPPLGPNDEPANPAVMTLPPIESWRLAS